MCQVYTPDTKDKKKIEWDMRLRNKSVAVTMLMGAQTAGAGSDAGGRNYSAPSSTSSSTSSDPTKGTTSPVDGAVKGAKKLKDLFGF